MEGRDLFTLLNLKAKGSTDRMFGWHQRGKRVALHIALALHYLHARKLTHFDIKARAGALWRCILGGLLGGKPGAGAGGMGSGSWHVMGPFCLPSAQSHSPCTARPDPSANWEPRFWLCSPRTCC